MLLLATPPLQTTPPTVPIWATVLGVLVVLLLVAATIPLLYLVVKLVIRAGKRPPSTGAESLVGATGIAVSDIKPSGVAQISSQLWTADAAGPAIRKGHRVRVTAVEGLRVRVVEIEDDPALRSADA